MKIRDSLKRAWTDRRGNTAAVFALSLVALLTVVGGAIDFGQLYSERAKAQDALDEAALMASISLGEDSTVLQTTTSNNFDQAVASNHLTAKLTDFKYDTTTRNITAAAAGNYTPYLLQLAGFKTLTYNVTTTTTRSASGTLEVALVLDNTWSMSVPLDGTQTKIQVLKTAAQSLVSSVMTPDNKAYVKMAIVPYADYVNVGTGNRALSWLSVPADYSTTSAQTCTTISTKQTCTGGTYGTCSSQKDGVPYTYGCWLVAQTCTTVAVTPYQSCSGGSTTNYKWYGCVNNQIASSLLAMPDPVTPYVGTLATSQKCLNPIVPLTNESATVASGINGLVVNIGSYQPETYIPAGLVWGVNVLSPPAPFSEGATYDSNNKMPRKAIVLMTDGANTLYVKTDGTVGTANATQLAKTYTDQQKVCDYAKAKKIEIYTIGFGVTDTTALGYLKSCASDTAHYFDAKSSADLIAAFKTIGGKLSIVRIAK